MRRLYPLLPLLLAACGSNRPTPTPSADKVSAPAADDAATLVYSAPAYVEAQDFALLRRNPVAARVYGKFLPYDAPWRQLGSDFDPVRDTDWVVESDTDPKPAVPTARAVVLHYSVPDAVVDAAIDAYPSPEAAPPLALPHGKARAVFLRKDKYSLPPWGWGDPRWIDPRWMLRVQPGLLVLVPLEDGPRVVSALAHAAPRLRMGAGHPSETRVPARKRPNDSSLAECGGGGGFAETDWTVFDPSGGVDMHTEESGAPTRLRRRPTSSATSRSFSGQ